MAKFLMFLTAFLLLVSGLKAQSRTITGRITDEKGAAMPNVSVVVQGGTGTTSDNDGRYSVNAPANARTIEFSSVNYGTQQISIGNRTNINVTMTEAGKSLDEVVVVGYGTQRRREVTGNVAL